MLFLEVLFEYFYEGQAYCEDVVATLHKYDYRLVDLYNKIKGGNRELRFWVVSQFEK